VIVLLFRIVDYQNFVFGVKKFEGKACRGAARLSEDGGVPRRNFCIDREMGGSLQAAVARLPKQFPPNV